MKTLNARVAEIKRRYADYKTYGQKGYMLSEFYIPDVATLFEKIKDLEKRLEMMNRKHLKSGK